jgi:hypothetical protein
MDDSDGLDDHNTPVQPPGPDDSRGLDPWSAFIEHVRHGHGVENVPDDEAEVWRLHQKLHGR